MHLSAAIPWGGSPWGGRGLGNPWAFAPRHLQIPPTQGPKGGTWGFKWQGWSNGAKSRAPQKSLGLPAKPQKIPGPKINPQKNPMPILWSLKVPQRGNAICRTMQHYRFFLIPKKLPTHTATHKKILAKFSYPKNPRIENFKPKKNPLIIPVTWNPEYPPGPRANILPQKATTVPHPGNIIWQDYQIEIFQFQDGGDVTTPAGLSQTVYILPRKCKSSPMPLSQTKKWQQKSANPALFTRMSPGSSPRDGCW